MGRSLTAVYHRTSPLFSPLALARSSRAGTRGCWGESGVHVVVTQEISCGRKGPFVGQGSGSLGASHVERVSSCRMCEGEKRKLVIPSELGKRPVGLGGIGREYT